MKFDVPLHTTAVLEIDLSALAHNYQTIQAAVPSHCRIGAVVKCNAYGLGAVPVVKRLHKIGCRQFFVACAQEGLEIRPYLPVDQSFIYILNGFFPGTEALYVEHKLIPVLISLEQAKNWSVFAKTIGEILPAVIHVDTGLGREGLTLKEVQELCAQSQDYSPHIDLHFIMSHLGNSNDESHPKNKQQLDRFQWALKSLRAAWNNTHIPASFVNSSGVSLGPDYHFDIVRPGAALYGYKSAWGPYLPLELTVRSHGRILRTHWIEANETMGYQGTFTCPRKTHVALIATGHGDGVMRGASNRGAFMINGHRAPILGRVSMDQVMVDITDHPEGNAVAGDFATLYDDTDSIKDFAEAAQTSVYEILVRQGHRHFRIYKD